MFLTVMGTNYSYKLKEMHVINLMLFSRELQQTE